MYEMIYSCVTFDIGLVCGLEPSVPDVCVASGY